MNHAPFIVAIILQAIGLLWLTWPSRHQALSWPAALRAHLSYHREAYLFAPAALVLLWLGIHYVGALTGRDVTEDIGSLVACMVALARVALIALFVGALQQHFFGYRSERTDARMRDDVFDALVSAFLFLALGYVVFCK